MDRTLNIFLKNPVSNKLYIFIRLSECSFKSHSKLLGQFREQVILILLCTVHAQYYYTGLLLLCVYVCIGCTGGKEWQECGTACPLTCDNHDEPQTCTFQCVQGCFCPGGTVEHNGTCVTTDQCPGMKTHIASTIFR